MSANPGIIVDVEQGSDPWAKLRCGKITASRFADVIATTKKGEGAARRDYRVELMVERLTHVPVEQYVSKEMRWGLEQEPFARAAYEMHLAQFVETVGFVIHPDHDFFGCSPDALVGEKGMAQFKCPNTTTHLGWMLAGTIPLEHIPQLLAELACNPDREWIDFVSYDPRLPEHLQLYVKRYLRNDELISKLVTEVVHFNSEVEQVLRALPPGPQAAAILLDFPKKDEVEY